MPARVLPYTQNGACDMFSMPPASTVCDSPSWIICAALTIDWMPEPHRRLTVSPPAACGAPALSSRRGARRRSRRRGLQRVADHDVVDRVGGDLRRARARALAACAARSIALESLNLP
jgi:hypothetical protein